MASMEPLISGDITAGPMLVLTHMRPITNPSFRLNHRLSRTGRSTVKGAAPRPPISRPKYSWNCHRLVTVAVSSMPAVKIAAAMMTRRRVPNLSASLPTMRTTGMPTRN